MKRWCKRASAGLFAFCAVLLGLITYTANTFPDHYYATDTGPLPLSCGLLSSTATPSYSPTTVYATASESGQPTASVLRLWGIFPVKEVVISPTKQPVVLLGGTPFGIKLYTEGVLIVGMTPVEDADSRSPAQQAGLRIGDVVLSVNGTSVSTNEELCALIAESGGQPLSLEIRREGVTFAARLSPVFSSAENAFKAGMWVRDSSAGIGTVTFYDPQTRRMAGLGHAVCDVDTTKPLPIGSGELVPATIFGLRKGRVGQAGELRGCFESGSLGSLMANLSTGVFGELRRIPSDAQSIPLAMKQQVVTGPATVRTTLQGQSPEWYDVEIVQIRYYDHSPTHNMVVRITDPRLLEQAGGIVQGMSGSPIVQNGRLIGAITHVFVNDPTQGFGIFAENMYESMCTLEQTDNAA